ncbi:hypothetical protein K466DRAFT_54897 [Polyporus arcularius HHB13444]|uniref:Uncharacterized protein n=1 Tax=Polyporus arcularius HHB13444 TaxID=1314778 RepID=A0A5C3PGG0_9APHY|nr:hypothetical protein K466DRAFT_54897 [Polyporus arcularius HHB13444]
MYPRQASAFLCRFPFPSGHSFRTAMFKPRVAASVVERQSCEQSKACTVVFEIVQPPGGGAALWQVLGKLHRARGVGFLPASSSQADLPCAFSGDNRLCPGCRVNALCNLHRIEPSLQFTGAHGVPP